MKTGETKINPEELQKKVNEYFKHCDNNPLIKYDVVKTGERAGQILEIPVARPYSKQGIIEFLNINTQTWYNWANSEQNNKDILEIVTDANNKIARNQIEGAGSGLFNPMIIARLQGLTDKQEITQTTIDTTNKSQDEIRAAIQAIEAARKK